MKKLWLVLLVIIVMGCSTPKAQTPTDNPADMLLGVPDEWKAKYGDSEQSKLYFNMLITQQAVNNHAKIINKLVADVNDCFKPEK